MLTGRKHDKVKVQKHKVYQNDDGDEDEEDENGDGDYYDLSDDTGDELKEYSDARSKRRRKIRQRKRRAVSIFLILLLVVLICLNWNTFAPAALTQATQSFFGNFGKSRFPVDFEEGSLKAAVPVGSDIGILTDTSFLIYSQKGNRLAVRSHGLNEAAAVSGGGKALIYDRGGKQFRVETRFGEPFSSMAAYNITTAAMGDCGNFAIITEADNYLSELTVYDNSYKNVFKWDASQGRILAAALSPDGKELAAVVVGAKNGSMYSNIYIFELGSVKPVAQKEYDGELFYSIRFKDNTHIAAVSSDETVFLQTSGKQESIFGYQDKELECSSNGDGPVVLAFEKGVTQSEIVSLDGEGKKLGGTDIAATGVTGVSNSQGKTVIVTSGNVFHMSDDCTGASSIAGSANMLSALSLKGCAYVFGTQSVGCYQLK